MLKHETDKLEIYSFDSEYRKRNSGKGTSIPALGLKKKSQQNRDPCNDGKKQKDHPKRIFANMAKRITTESSGSIFTI